MERIFHYYSLKEAEEIRHTYSSWIGKKAYMRNGRQAILKGIIIRRAHELNNGRHSDGYFVEFEFGKHNISDSYEFMTCNGLSPEISPKPESGSCSGKESSPEGNYRTG